MKLELKQSEYHHHSLILNTAYSREETLEMIVPDACPDIAEIIDTYAFCCLHRQEMTDTGPLLAGVVRASILYRPESDGPVQRLEALLPFQHMLEGESSPSACVLQARADILQADTRIINPRKVLVRADIAECLQLYRPEDLATGTELAAPPEYGVEQRQEHYQTTLIQTPSEKSFPLEDTLTLPNRKGPVNAVIRLQPEVLCTEYRLIGAKLILKGNVLLQALCLHQDGALSSLSYDLPFSQVLDASGAGEGAEVSLSLFLSDYTLGPVSEDGFSLPIALALSAQAVFYETLTVPLLTDAYSIAYPVVLERQPVLFPCRRESPPIRQPVRILVETDAPSHTILGVHGALSLPQCRCDSSQGTLSVSGHAAVLYEAEDGRCHSQTAKFTAEAKLFLPPQAKLSAKVALSQLEALPSATGLEIRATVEFLPQVWETYSVPSVIALSVDEENPLDLSAQPSVVLRRPAAEDTLWAIAKRYATTCQEICRANHISEEQPLDGKMLLIPRKR